MGIAELTLFRDGRWNEVKTTPLVFRLYVKVCDKLDIETADIYEFTHSIKDLVLNYLMSYVLGRIQIKCAFNKDNDRGRDIIRRCEYEVMGLEAFMRVHTHSKLKVHDGYCYHGVDYEFFSVSASSKELAEKDVEHVHGFDTDCAVCSNSIFS